jgi:hypothetical protein
VKGCEHDAELSNGDDARLVSLLIEGLTRGEDIPVTPGFWRELQVDAAKILVKQKVKKI